jgi:hypothetical protein
MLIGDPKYWHERAELLRKPQPQAITLPPSDDAERMAVVVANQYDKALRSIMRHRGRNGGWPPRDLAQVCGWQMVQIVADIFGKTPRDVAQDLIDRFEQGED